mgnify:CR=1 FL=1
MKFNKPVTLEEYAMSNPKTRDGMKELRAQLTKHSAELETVLPGCVKDMEDILAYPVGRYARWKFWHPRVIPSRVAIGMGKLNAWELHLMVMSQLGEARKQIASTCPE